MFALHLTWAHEIKNNNGVLCIYRTYAKVSQSLYFQGLFCQK